MEIQRDEMGEFVLVEQPFAKLLPEVDAVMAIVPLIGMDAVGSEQLDFP